MSAERQAREERRSRRVWGGGRRGDVVVGKGGEVEWRCQRVVRRRVRRVGGEEWQRLVIVGGRVRIVRWTGAGFGVGVALVGVGSSVAVVMGIVVERV